ncbi:S41 family peptidase [Shewanella intestini]|uniref:Peptidase n=1 Tax=Shewanella intestini TaxID=2017544 RepID=A0ABS5I3E0_9GAMM|nr:MULTISPECIES: S41 family peptidase [Shewanella]MBR9728421.1 peptidase [Shewanella intestini]MRG36763.1 peptidase [Shewanella sp. XMDDZSB0408]
MTIRSTMLSLLAAISLTACGGSSNDSGSDAPMWVAGQYTPYSELAQQCSSTDNLTEKLWLRSWSNDTYLWYDEIVDTDPANVSVTDYFNQLKTQELSDTGNKKDNFHFYMSTPEWQQLNQSGASFGYGMNVKLQNAAQGVPRQVTITFTEPNTPAADVNISRGAMIISVDGVNVENAADSASIDILNAGLFPSVDGKQTEFEVRDLNSSVNRTVTMTAQTVIATPVQNTKVLQTTNAKVGYLQFNTHIATAERGLFDAFNTLSTQGVDDLVIDLRYNGGGLLAIASQMAYMVAGNNATQNKVFERTSFNDKYPNTDPVLNQPLEPMPFFNQTLGFNTDLIGAGTHLPTLNLKRVFVLTTASTCSASEAFINALRGVDIEVIQLGGTTCGKPYGFYPTDNCNTTYFTIQFKGVNDKGFGEYSDGFTPSQNATTDSEINGCPLEDDLSHGLGDPNERLLSAALYYRDNNTCPVNAQAKTFNTHVAPGFVDEGFILKDTRMQNVLFNNRILGGYGGEQ